MLGLLYTIGHEGLKYDQFLWLLKKYKIDYLIDVRSDPYEKWSENYNKENLMNFLSENDITYIHMGNRFGARPKDRTLYTNDQIDYKKVRESENFQEGVINVIKGLEEGKNIALMCLERDPIDCHRAIMVSKGFIDKGIITSHIKVKPLNAKKKKKLDSDFDDMHILLGDSIETQIELENRLLAMYGKNQPNQFSLFDDIRSDASLNTKEEIEECYILRNNDINYKTSKKFLYKSLKLDDNDKNVYSD